MLTGRGDGRFDVSLSGAGGENPADLAISGLVEDGLADFAVANPRLRERGGMLTDGRILPPVRLCCFRERGAIGSAVRGSEHVCL